MSVRSWRPETTGGSVEGTWADIAFGLGLLYEHEDDLERAARWFREAAEGDRPGAAIRLSAVLGRLADQRASGPAEPLLAEATRWLSEGLDATRPDAIGLITDMLDRHQRAAARRGLEPAGTR
jgi:hypothetical protein